MEMMPAIANAERRIVLEYPGGMHEIIGRTDKQPPITLQGTMEWVLVACRPRFYLYKQKGQP